MNTAHTVAGRPVQILAIDADPSALVWIVFCDNPDEEAFVTRAQLGV